MAMIKGVSGCRPIKRVQIEVIVSLIIRMDGCDGIRLEVMTIVVSGGFRGMSRMLIIDILGEAEPTTRLI